MPLPTPIAVRRYATCFAVILGLQAAWILSAELMRPANSFFPASADQAKIAAANYTHAATAAWLGWPRRDLWSDYAVAANAALIGDIEAGSGAAAANKDASDVAETAAKLAPSDARNWVLLAMSNLIAGNYSKALAQLKMSYYTAPFSEDLFPVRIAIAARSASAADDELGSYVEYELGVIVREKPDLKRSIALAYQQGSVAGRQFLDRTLTKLDPTYLAQLKASKP